MKNIILLLALSLTASAHMIEGTLMLKGAIKTKIVVNTVKTTCKVKIEKVRNLMQEDSLGNPAYIVRANISLDGSDFERSLSVKFDRDFMFDNLFTTATGTEVRDFDYKSPEGAAMKIDGEGRVKSVSFPTQYKLITCTF